MNETAQEQYYRKKLTQRADRNFIANLLMIIAFTISIAVPFFIGLFAGGKVAEFAYDPFNSVREDYKNKVEAIYNQHHEKTLENAE